MADVLAANQRDEPVPEHKKEIKIAAHEPADSSAATSETSSDNQLNHEEIEDVDADDAKREMDIEEEDIERRLTWIGEGLLDGEGLKAVEQLLNLPTSPQKPSDRAASLEIQEQVTEEKPQVERSGSKLLDFLAKEEGYNPEEKPTVAAVRPPAPSKPETAAPVENKRQNKLLDFLATDVGERYLDGLYTEEDSDEEPQKEAAEQPQESAAAAAATAQNKLLEFLARERGERVHEVEKVELNPEDQPRRSEPYTVPIRIETPETAAAALAAEAASRSTSPGLEPTTITELDDDGNPVLSASQRKLADFVKKVQPSRPKFVLFNPEDLVSSSSGSETDEVSPTSNPKDFRLKKRSQQEANRVRFANPGLDLQTGVIRQAVTDHYGREELLDFVAEVVDSPAIAKIERAVSPAEPPRHETPPPLRQETPPPRHESPPVRRESPPARRESPIPLAPARKPDSRFATFLKKFSSKSKTGSDSSSRNGSRSNSPDLDARHSAPPHQEESHRVHFTPAPFLSRTSVESEPDVSTPLESKLANRQSFEPSPRSVLSGSENNEPSSKRIALLGSLRQLLEDCEKNELSDISMVRISILLSTVNQIVRDDLRKERPAQTLMRRLSMHVPGAQNGQSTGVAASWVRSNKEQEEYERGHTVTTSDIASQFQRKRHSPEPRAPSPQHTLLTVEQPIGDSAMTSFTQFETSQNMFEVIHSFERLLNDLGINEAAARTPLRVYNHVKSALYSQFSFRQKQLFRLLDAKLAVDVYKRQPCSHKRVCVIGAGPVGLRAAVELALLGGQVVVIDKRKTFNRENILHMWPWVVQDLTSLGAKVFFPQFCHSSAYFHVGTRQMQCILLKVALLLGVKMYPGTSFEGIAAPDSIVSERKSYYTVVTKPQMPWQEFTSVLGACGTKDKLAAHAGIKRFVFSRKEAIGLVCYFPNLGTNEEKKVNEFSWTIQFKQRLFAKMRDIGIDLENVVYYRGEYHYIVMTPKRNNLIQQGVLKINYPSVSDLVAVENIDPSALNDYVSRIINFFEIPQKSEFARVRLFDFSTRTRAAQAANILSSRGKKLYVGLVGDALMEPFWPEGLGTCRGFLSAMDACWMVSQIGKQSDEQILADRELGYRIVQHISGFQRDDLQKNVRKYNVDPSSRYTVQYPATITY